MSRRALLGFAVGAIVAGLLGMAGVGLWWAAGRSGGRAGGPAGGTGRDAVDAVFIQQMIPHHDDAIAMSELAMERAEHPELRRLASRIARTQTRENRQMRSWYAEWFGGEVPERSRPPMMMGRSADLEELEASEDIDRTFIEMMVPHHRMAIMMARMAGSRTGREEMRDFCSEIERTQAEEIDLMQGWYREWYGR